LEGTFDIIVSNPPYVRALEKKEMSNNVKKYEPSSALFVPDEDPLKFYKKIIEFSLQHLAQNGQLYFEINQYLGKETIRLLKEYDFKDIELKKDLFGNDRCIKALKPIL
ncbi:MAG: protein-(glutamine-N5) methyltransferase, release factor-specific, partial [Flavobacteriaceae bacterium]